MNCNGYSYYYDTLLPLHKLDAPVVALYYENVSKQLYGRTMGRRRVTDYAR